MRRYSNVLAALVISVVSRGATAGSVVYLGPDERSGASQAVIVEGHALVHTRQVLPLDKDGSLIGEGSVEAQLAHALFNLETALAAAGSDIDQLVRLNVYANGEKTADSVRKMFARRFRAPVRPAMSWVCTSLAHPKALLALDAVAIQPGDGPPTVVRKRCEALAGDTRIADAAVLPRGEVIYVSGVAEKGDLAGATAQTLERLMETVHHLGLDRSQVVQLKAFLQPMGQADIVKQQVSALFANEPAPPIVFVEWTATTPIEIEMIVFAPAEKSAAPPSDTVTYFTPPGVTASPVYSKVARIHGGKHIYLSGLYADKPGDGQAQVRSIFAALKGVAEAAGSDLRHLVKATYYVSDDDASTMLNKLRPDYYDPYRPPAASKAMVKGVGLSGRSITLDMIAVTPPQ